MLISSEEILEAKEQISSELSAAICKAKRNIEKFHKAQKTAKIVVNTDEGVECWQEKRPIQKVGLYIPGGTAPLFSSVLMLAIPAQIAGCSDIVLCTPPNKQGKINPVIIYTAQLCGVTRIIKVGGIQAIAGLTFGTETIPQVYKIFGPGNQYVTIAKQLATKYGVAIDMPAGPSELLVVADATANASFVASDLLSQAEHGTDSQVILVSTSLEKMIAVEKEIENQIQHLSRISIAEKAIENSKLIPCTPSQSARTASAASAAKEAVSVVLPVPPFPLAIVICIHVPIRPDRFLKPVRSQCRPLLRLSNPMLILRDVQRSAAILLVNVQLFLPATSVLAPTACCRLPSQKPVSNRVECGHCRERLPA